MYSGTRYEHIVVQIEDVAPHDISHESGLYEPENIYNSTKTEKSEFITLAVNLGYIITIKQKLDVFIRGGFYFSIAMEQEVETTDSFLLYTYIPDPIGTYDPPYGKLPHWYISQNEFLYEKHHKGGIEFAIEFKLGNFVLELRDNLALTKTTKMSYINGFDENMNTFTVTLGYCFDQY